MLNAKHSLKASPMPRLISVTPSETDIAASHDRRSEIHLHTRFYKPKSKEVYRKKLSTPNAKDEIVYFKINNIVAGSVSYLA